MKYYNTMKQVAGGIVLAATLTVSSQMAAQDSLIAMGIVNNAGTLLNSANTVGGTISIVDQGTGDHDIVINAAGAFAGDSPDDFIVELTQRLGDTDNFSYRGDVAVNNNQLTVTVHGVDLEDSTNPFGPLENDTHFGFVIRRINGSSIPAGTSHLIALGRLVSASGAISAGFGVDGIALSSTNTGTGDYDITLTKTGAFSSDVANDYVVMSTANGSTLDDERPTVNSISTGSDDNVVINIRTHDVQEAVAGDAGTLNDEPIHFVVYRIPSSPGNGIPQSQLLIGAANVSSGGALLEGATPLPGGNVSSSSPGTGDYEVVITSPGAFAGMSSSQYVVQATININGFDDAIIQAQPTVVDDNTLRIDVATIDVEDDGEATGFLQNAGFSVVVYDTGARFQPDLRIGTKKSFTKMKGNNRYNGSGAGQGIKITLKGTAFKRFYFAVENDGTSLDDIKLREKGAGSILKTKYFRLTGGRTNITAQVRTQSEVISNLRPGRNVRIEGQAKYKKLSKRPNRKLKIKGSSLFQGSASDTVKAKTVAGN